MKMRTIKFSPQLLIEKLQTKTSTGALDLPSDAELLGIKYDVFSGEVVAVIRSETYEDAKDAYPVPEAPVVGKSVVQQNLLQKAEAKLFTTPKPQAPTVSKVQVQPKRNTSLMEEEFSDEQRKILSFTVDGDFLVVKPVKFLKAEWDDINEVVRSLGGRWVKGDIISYWEVPLPQK
jgi:hypothetical protein